MKNGIVLLSCIFELTVFGIFNLWPIGMFSEPFQVFLSNQMVKRILLLHVLIGFSLTVKAATLIFISGRGSAISSARKGKSGFIYNLVKS